MSDLISREAVLNKIAEIESLTSKQTEWISVKDSRKPKIRERVWVTESV